MEEQDWIQFKFDSEENFKSASLEECWGYQIQKNTKWNKGLNLDEIHALEAHYGFSFPVDYISMIQVINGFDTPQISIDPDGNEPAKFDHRCYTYPNDLEKSKWLIEEANQYITFAEDCLQQHGFEPTQLEGFVPLYEHRALAVLNDKTKSPVLSIYGDDIILYGKSLLEYWKAEFDLI